MSSLQFGDIFIVRVMSRRILFLNNMDFIQEAMNMEEFSGRAQYKALTRNRGSDTDETPGVVQVESIEDEAFRTSILMY